MLIVKIKCSLEENIEQNVRPFYVSDCFILTSFFRPVYELKAVFSEPTITSFGSSKKSSAVLRGSAIL